MTGNAREEFARRFDLLLRDSGLQTKQVVSQVMDRRPRTATWKVTAGLISAWRTGRNLPSTSSNDAFMLVVRVVTELARRRSRAGYPIDPLPDEVAWTEMLNQARIVTAGGVPYADLSGADAGRARKVLSGTIQRSRRRVASRHSLAGPRRVT